MKVERQVRNRARLTRRLVETRRAEHSGKRERAWDTEVTQMFLLITEKGSASYCIRYIRPDGTRTDFTLISADLASPEEARQSAVKRLAALKLEGIDPAEARRKQKQDAETARIDTFAALATRFDEERLDLSDGDRDNRRLYMNRYIQPRFGKRHFREIEQAEIKAFVRDVQQTIAKGERARERGWEGHDGANLCQFIMRRIFAWAISQKIMTGDNPASFEPIFPHEREARIEKFNADNFAAMWKASYDRVFSGRARIVVALATLLYLVTLQRPIDIARSRREDLDLESATWIIPKARTKKKKKSYYIPLSPLACRLFKIALELQDGEAYLFPSYASKGHIVRASLTQAFLEDVKVLTAAGILSSGDLELYDGRRFGRTEIEETLGFGERIGELVINHFDENRPGRIYNVHNYRNDIRRAQVAWSAHIVRMVGSDTFGALPGVVEDGEDLLDAMIEAHEAEKAKRLRGRSATVGRSDAVP